jgi:hypothetical protein|tara:strand:+ start:344 stop:511 length:168 start_codon:yes stop_codon:yes gene_type:complete
MRDLGVRAHLHFGAHALQLNQRVDVVDIADLETQLIRLVGHFQLHKNRWEGRWAG